MMLQGLETYTGSWDCASKIMSKHGIKGLYRGFTSTVLRDIQVRHAHAYVACVVYFAAVDRQLAWCCHK